MQNRTSDATKLVIVIDDDSLVLEATAGLLISWGCEVVTATSYEGALQKLLDAERRPDLIICDYRLSDEHSGVDAIRGLRHAFEIPALLISGDPVPPGEQADGGYSLLQKPLDASRFRAAVVGASVLQ